MRGLLGLVIGLIVGAGAMYLVLRWPWGGRSALAPSDAGMGAIVLVDAGAPGKPKPKRRPGGGRGGTVAAPGGPGDTDETEPEPVQLTEADRRLEWRGDVVALPTKKIDMSAGADARPLEDAEIHATFASQGGEVQKCVEQGATGTGLRATITLELLVDGNGRVTKSRVQAPRYLLERGLLGCAQRALGKMRFPATGAPTVATQPLTVG